MTSPELRALVGATEDAVPSKTEHDRITESLYAAEAAGYDVTRARVAHELLGLHAVNLRNIVRGMLTRAEGSAA